MAFTAIYKKYFVAAFQLSRNGIVYISTRWQSTSSTCLCPSVGVVLSAVWEILGTS